MSERNITCEPSNRTVNIQFIDKEITLLLDSFLFTYSNYFKLFETYVNTYVDTIYILCPSTYIFDEKDECYFNAFTNNDLTFMFTLQPIDKFINLCKFLDLVEYDNKDEHFSKEYILYIMKNNIDVSNIKIFMRHENISITNYVNNVDIYIQLNNCTIVFYLLYLTEYKEEVIKYNRYEIFDKITDKIQYYPFVNKYNSILTNQIKHTDEYKEYILSLNKRIIPLCGTNNPDMILIKKLVEYGADVNYHINSHYTALHNACNFKNNIELVTFLVEQGAYINFQTLDGSTALHYACNIFNSVDIVTYLIENGADIYIQTNNGYTALHYACNNVNNINVVKILVETCIKQRNECLTYINIKTNLFGCTAAHCAALRLNNFNVIKYLIETCKTYNENITNVQNNNGKTLLHFVSVIQENTDIIKYLIRQGIYVNLQDNNGNTALHDACEITNNYLNVRCLINNDANIYIRDNNNKTILHYASYVPYNIGVIKYLIKLGININLQDRFHRTALHNTCNIRNNIRVIKYLIQNNADISLCDIDNKTALQYASSLSHNYVVNNYLHKLYNN